MADLKALTAANQRRWNIAKVMRDAGGIAQKLCSAPAKARYQVVAKTTGVPWFIIAVIHYREANQSWMANLAQGDRWDQVSTHVPQGRGPFRSFEAAAVDALTNCAPYAAKWSDWSAGGSLCLLEQYNGLGYASKGLPSPYVWAGTDQYVKGKYVRDGVYDPNVVDAQLGCAAILKVMMQIDPTITFTGAKIIPLPEQPKPVSPPPSIWAAFLSAILSLFKRK